MILFQKDHLGSTRVVTDEYGNKKGSQSEYTPYGLERNTNGQTESSYKYTDQEEDKSTGLYNYDARMYDPGLRMFTSADTSIPDWYNPQFINRYIYSLNNPVALKDPTGHSPTGLGIAMANHPLDPAAATALAKAMGIATASMAPYVGEALDAATLADPNASKFDKAMAGISLAIAAVCIVAANWTSIKNAVKSLGNVSVPGKFRNIDVALGVHENLSGFKGNALTGTDFDVDPMKGLEQSILDGIDSVVEKGGDVHFNLDDVDLKGALKEGYNQELYDTVTSKELRHVLEKHKAKTHFYENGEEVKDIDDRVKDAIEGATDE